MKNYYHLNQKGLTLIELLAVIVILAILVTIAIPSISNVIANQRDKAILSDIVAMVETSKMQYVADECGDSICEYDSSNAANNEISFNSSKFTIGIVKFTDLPYPDDVIITDLDINDSDFKGRNKDRYINLISTTGGFTEKALLDVLNNR